MMNRADKIALYVFGSMAYCMYLYALHHIISNANILGLILFPAYGIGSVVATIDLHRYFKKYSNTEFFKEYFDGEWYCVMYMMIIVFPFAWAIYQRDFKKVSEKWLTRENASL